MVLSVITIPRPASDHDLWGNNEPITILDAMEASMSDDNGQICLCKALRPNSASPTRPLTWNCRTRSAPENRVTTRYQQTYNGVPSLRVIDRQRE